MDNTILITLKFFQVDPSQTAFAVSLEKMIPSTVRKVGELHSSESGLLSGKSLMKKGTGALMLDTALAQLREAGYGLNDAYVAHDDGRNKTKDEMIISKITFIFQKGTEESVDLANLLVSLTKESGWAVKRYENGGDRSNTAFGCTQPNNMTVKVEKASAKGHPITPARLEIFA